MLGDGASRLLRIPPGVAHGVRNLGGDAGRIIYFTDVHFSAEPVRLRRGSPAVGLRRRRRLGVTRGDGRRPSGLRAQ